VQIIENDVCTVVEADADERDDVNIPQMRHQESSTTNARPALLTRPRGVSSRERACSRGDSATNHSTA
jgi:hypothetical protein